MSRQEKQDIIDAIGKADLLLISMKGQMDIVQDYAERTGGVQEYNDRLHIAIMMKTMIDGVRAALDDAAQIAV